MKVNSLSLGKNYFYNILYEVFRIIVPLLTTPYISRVLGADGVGTYTLAHTYVQYFILFAGLGFATYAARELAYVRDDYNLFKKTFIEISLSRLFLSLIAIVIYVIIFYVYEWKDDISYKFCLIYLIASVFDVSYYFKAIENFRTVAVRNIFIKFFAMILVFVFVKTQDQVWLYTMILALSEFVGQAIMLKELDWDLFKSFTIDKQNIVKHFKGSLALFIPSLAIQVYTMLDKVMLGEICGEIQTGYYENAQKMVRLASTVASAMVSVVVPRMAYYFANNHGDQFKKQLQQIFSYVSFLVFPMCFGLAGVASSFSEWYYGSSFVGIEILVMAGAPLIISLGWSNVLGNMVLISTNNQKYYTIAVYSGAISNVVLNFALIPRFASLGATLASVAAEFVGMLIMLYFSNKIIIIGDCFSDIFYYLLASIIMLITILIVGKYIEHNIFGTLVQVFVGLLIYLLLMIIIHNKVLFQMIELVIKRKKAK